MYSKKQYNLILYQGIVFIWTLCQSGTDRPSHMTIKICFFKIPMIKDISSFIK